MYKLTLHLTPQEKVNVYNRPYGYVLRGFFLNWLKHLEPKRVHEFHGYNKMREYALNLWIKDERHISFTLNTFEDRLGERLLEDVQKTASLQIGEFAFSLEGIEAGPIDLEALYKSRHPVQIFSLFFPKPTYFNTSYGDFPVRTPIPEVIYSNILSLWEKVSGEKGTLLANPFLEWLNTHLYIRELELKTRKAYIGRKRVVGGFTGTLTMRLKKPNLHYFKKKVGFKDLEHVWELHLNYAGWIEFLSKIAEYTNVGVNRTASLGVVKYTPLKHFSK